MPRYRLHADHVMFGSIQKAGTVVEYDGNPGSQLEPLDDAAWARFNAYREERKRLGHAPLTRFPFRVIEQNATGAKTIRAPMDGKLPENWRELKGLALTNTAKRLGAPHGINAPNAARYLQEYAERQKAAIEPPKPEDPALDRTAIADGGAALTEESSYGE